MDRSGEIAAIEPPLDRHAVLLRGIGVILVSSVMFGAMAVCVRLAAQHMPSSQIAWVRFTGSLLILLALRRGRDLRPLPGNARRVVFRGLLGASAIFLYYRAIAWAGAAFATLLHCTYPVFTALFATALMEEPFDRRLGAALALSLLGVSIVVGPGSGIAPHMLLGGLSALAAAVLAGAAVATARQLRLTESTFLVTTYFMAVGAASTAPALFLGLPALSAHLLLALAGVVLTSVAGQLLLHQGLGYAAATQASLAAATSVVTATVLEATFLGTRMSAQTLFGACFLIGAVALSVSRRR